MQQNTNLRQKFKQYSEKAINNKTPAEFKGIAKQYGSFKKERMMSQQLFDSYLHQVSSIQKINKSLAKSLSKKKRQLKYVQAVRNRYIAENLQKQKIAQMKQIELAKLKNRTLQQKYSSEVRSIQARQKMLSNKKQEYQRTKKQLTHYRSEKIMEQSRIWQKKQSQVKFIEEQKVRIKDYYNRFFQNKNKKFMQSYNELIQKEKIKEQKFKQQTKNLQIKLVMLKQNAEKKSKMLDQLNNSIDSIRQSRVNLRSSRHASTRSMTPLQVISMSGGMENPQKPRLKLVQKGK